MKELNIKVLSFYQCKSEGETQNQQPNRHVFFLFLSEIFSSSFVSNMQGPSHSTQTHLFQNFKISKRIFVSIDQSNCFTFISSCNESEV